MKILAQYVFPTLFAATILLTPRSMLAQELGPPSGVPPPQVGLPVQNTCPRPITLTLKATPPNVFTGDFTPAQLSAPRVGLNDPVISRHFLYTFQWKSEHKCCQITRAVLTVKMKANSEGTPGGSNASNDAINLMNNGQAIPPSGPVYSSQSFPAGTPATKTWNLTGAALSNINANQRVSFNVQDDTSVLSATLQLWGCCLTSGAMP